MHGSRPPGRARHGRRATVSRRSGRRGRRGRSRPRRDRPVDLERYRSFVPDWDAFVSASLRPEPTVIRVRTGRIEPSALAERLTEQGFRLRPLALDLRSSFFLLEEEPVPVSQTLEHWAGLVYVQQASTGVAAPALGPRPGERVLDLCAAPGGKTTHLAELMEDRGCLVASEISESRIRGLLGNVYRLGHPGVLAVAGDGRELPEDAGFDRVLVDAPCSGEGTLRRRAGRVPDQSSSFLAYVTAAQRALLEKAVRVTRPGGEILYVTCTFAPEENEAVVGDALARLPVELEPLRLAVPCAPGLTSFEGERFDPRLEGAARIYPHHFDSGGLFLAKLRRLDGPVDLRTAPRPDGSPEPAVDDAPRSGWTPVPALFPGDEGATDVAEAEERMRRGVEDVRARFGLERELDGVGWTMRGGRAWVHAVDRWPLEAWLEGAWAERGWRAISIGLRAIEFDSRGRARPTNDFLRWAEATGAMLELSGPELRSVLERHPVAVAGERRGPVAIGYRGEVVGRGVLNAEGLDSEIPKARARDLLRVLEASLPGDA